MVKVVPGEGWAASVQIASGEQLDTVNAPEIIEPWLRKELERVLAFQESRGGGLFILSIPNEVLD